MYFMCFTKHVDCIHVILPIIHTLYNPIGGKAHVNCSLQTSPDAGRTAQSAHKLICFCLIRRQRRGTIAATMFTPTTPLSLDECSFGVCVAHCPHGRPQRGHAITWRTLVHTYGSFVRAGTWLLCVETRAHNGNLVATNAVTRERARAQTDTRICRSIDRLIACLLVGSSWRTFWHN